MKESLKQLLLKDICVRLSYGVFMNTPNGDGHLCSINQTIFGNEYGINISATRRDYFNDEKLNFKPYLRPMSSMTEEEKKEFEALGWRVDELDDNFPWPHSTLNVIEGIDWLNKKMFDYRGLIEKGLALEAPTDMYI